MLKITRRVSQSFRLHTSDGIVEITICEVSGARVRVGVKAPKEVIILRNEIDETLQELPDG